MKQSSSAAYAYFHDSTITVNEAEFEAALALLKLPYLISQSESRSRRFSFTWGARRKRSSSTETTPTLSSSSPPSVPQTTVAAAAAAAVGPTRETTEKEKPKALSPATPLLFSPSESDYKSKQNPKRKVNFKRKKEEYLNMIEELTESNKIFKEEIKNLSSHFDEQKTLNLKLKAMADRINHGIEIEQAQQTQLSLNQAMALAQPRVQIDTQDQPQQSRYTVHQQPFLIDQTGHNSESSEYPYGQNFSFLSSTGGLFTINGNKVGPSIPLDLNLSLEESLSMESGQVFNAGMAMASKSETKAALAALARQRRIQICRLRNNTNASKLRYPVCR